MNARFVSTLALALVALSMTLHVSRAHAWTPDGQITRITEIITWEHNSSQVVYKLANQNFCWFYSTGQNGEAILSIVMAAFLGDYDVAVHCHDATDSVGGIGAHRHHRIVMMND